MNTELGYATTQMIPSEIERSNPVRVTVEGSNLSADQCVRATGFYPLPAADATGMYELNNRLFVVGNTTTDTFDLFDQYGEPIDGTAFTEFTGDGYPQFNLTGPDLNTQNLNTQP